MYCSNCGNQINNNSKFCPKCGNKVVENNQVNNNLQSPKKQKRKPYWLLGVIPFVTYVITIIIKVVIELTTYAGEGYMVEENSGIMFINTLLTLLGTCAILAFLPCLIVMIILYVTKSK